MATVPTSFWLSQAPKEVVEPDDEPMRLTEPLRGSWRPVGVSQADAADSAS
jgi:hypothetical protein